ncbi:putative capsid protein [Hermit crab associated circular virus]|nr:putative capsid protein [Hermit crab associated circular virus]AKV62277.1 putative capsid protein [Hermit crab associated circular virus]
MTKFLTPPRPSSKRLRAVSPKMQTGTPEPAHTIMPRGISTHMRKSAYHRNLGRRVGKYSTRRTLYTGFKNDLVSKKTYWSRLIRIPHYGAGQEEHIKYRRGAYCNVRGVKINYWFSMDANTQYPVQVRWAIINPKVNEGTDLTLVTNPENFFISKDPTTEQSENFPTTGNYFKYMNRKINRELYGVLKEGTFTMSIDPAAAVPNPGVVYRPGSAVKKIALYVPVNRQMKWNNVVAGDANGYPEQNLYFVWWYDTAANDNTNPSASPLVQEFHEKTIYFKNSQMFA